MLSNILKKLKKKKNENCINSLCFFSPNAKLRLEVVNYYFFFLVVLYGQASLTQQHELEPIQGMDEIQEC